MNPSQSALGIAGPTQHFTCLIRKARDRALTSEVPGSSVVICGLLASRLPFSRTNYRNIWSNFCSAQSYHKSHISERRISVILPFSGVNLLVSSPGFFFLYLLIETKLII